MCCEPRVLGSSKQESEKSGRRYVQGLSTLPGTYKDLAYYVQGLSTLPGTLAPSEGRSEPLAEA